VRRRTQRTGPVLVNLDIEPMKKPESVAWIPKFTGEPDSQPFYAPECTFSGIAAGDGIRRVPNPRLADQ